MKINGINYLFTFQGLGVVAVQEDCEGGHLCQESGQCIGKYLYHKVSTIIGFTLHLLIFSHTSQLQNYILK